VNIVVKRISGNLQVNVIVPELKLWNRLGSIEEVTNSEVGPNGEIVGSPVFTLCKFNNGVYVEDENHWISFNSSEFDVNSGCIEFWWKSPGDSSVIDPNYGKFVGICVSGMGVSLPYGKCRIIFHNLRKQVQFQYSFHDDSGVNNIYLISDVIPYTQDELIHWAIVWDKNGRIENAYTLAIYQNGSLIKGTNANITSSIPLTWEDNLKVGSPTGNSTASWDACKGPVDNIKVWNIPKTDFSDRFIE